MTEKGYVYTNRYHDNLVNLTTVHKECKVSRTYIEIFDLNYECGDRDSRRRKKKKKTGRLQNDLYFQQSYDMTYQPFAIMIKVKLLQAVLLLSTGQH